MVLGLISAVVLASGSLLKAIAMILLGLLLGMVGTDVETGASRYSLRHLGTVRRHRLRVGRDGHVRFRRDHPQPRAGAERTAIGAAEDQQPDADLEGPHEVDRAILRGTAIGSIFGILPGGGTVIASFSSYTLEKKIAKDPSRFGKGAIEGVAGPGSGQQRRRADLVHSAADAGHSAERGDGADGRRDDDPRHRAGPAGDDQNSPICSGA